MHKDAAPDVPGLYDKTIMLAHGWGLSPRMWAPVLQELAAAAATHGLSLQVIVLDFLYRPHSEGAAELPFPDSAFLDIHIVPVAVTDGVQPLQAYLPNAQAQDHMPDLGVSNMLCIGHSMGSAWLLHAIMAQAAQGHTALATVDFMAVNGFGQFIATETCPVGVPPRHLQAMLRRMPARPDVVWQGFYQAAVGALPAGWWAPQTPFAAPPAHTDAAVQGLLWLENLRLPADVFDVFEQCVTHSLCVFSPHDQIVPQAAARHLSATLEADVCFVPDMGSHLLPLMVNSREMGEMGWLATVIWHQMFVLPAVYHADLCPVPYGYQGAA
jgi:pimeloyl-ACP methyl ester carboxylesterase